MIKNSREFKNLQCVYKIVCMQNGFSYIGQTRNLARRVREHNGTLKKGCHRNKRLQDDYNKYGEHAFELLVVCVDGGDMDDIERRMITLCREEGKCYNVFSGGLIGYQGDDEFRRTMSNVHRGRKDNNETLALKSENAKRQWQNPEYRERMKKAASNQWADDEYRKMMLKLHTGGVMACGHKLTDEIVIEARRRYASGEKISVLAKEHGVTYCTMRNAVTGRTWKHLA